MSYFSYDKNSNSSIIAIPFILTFILIALKFSGVVDLEWIWILIPLWLPILLCSFALIVASLCLMIINLRK